MRYSLSNDADPQLDVQITNVLAEMTTTGVDSEEYPKLLSLLERLYEIKAEMRQSPISRDMLAQIVGNLMGILLIVAYEQKHVMTSKGFSQLFRVQRPT